VALLSNSPVQTTFIKAPPSIDVLALYKLPLVLEITLEVQLQTSKNRFNAISNPANVPSGLSLPYSCDLQYQIVILIIIYCCSLSAARQSLIDDLGQLPDFKLHFASSIDLLNVTR
jgi:hypothetical protein